MTWKIRKSGPFCRKPEKACYFFLETFLSVKRDAKWNYVFFRLETQKLIFNIISFWSAIVAKCKFLGILSPLKLNFWTCLTSYFCILSRKCGAKVKSYLKHKQPDDIKYSLWVGRKKNTIGADGHVRGKDWFLKSLKSPVDVFFNKEERKKT